MKNLGFTTTQSHLRACLLALGCADPERIAIVRPKGAGFAGGARYCSAFLWYSDERTCGETVVRVSGQLLSSDLPVFAEICEDRSVRQPLVMPRQVRQPVVVPPRVRETVGSATRVSVEPTSPLRFKRPRDKLRIQHLFLELSLENLIQKGRNLRFQHQLLLLSLKLRSPQVTVQPQLLLLRLRFRNQLLMVSLEFMRYVWRAQLLRRHRLRR